MVRDVNLLSNLPLFIQEYREIREIMSVENTEIQALEDETEIIKDNQFILTCNATGIQKFEELLGITPTEDDTLASRVSRVSVRWNDVIPYTYRVLLQKLSLLCGSSFEVSLNALRYEVEVVTHLDLYGQVDELQNLLETILPANLIVLSENTLTYRVYGEALLGTGLCKTDLFELSNDSVEAHTLCGSLFSSGAALVNGVSTEKIIITTASDDVINIASDAFVSSAVANTEAIQIIQKD